LARHQPALPFDLRPLAGDLPRGRLAPGGRLLPGPVGELAIDPGSEAAVDPFVAEIEDVVDPLAQAFLAVTLVPRGRRAPRLDLLLQPVARAIAVVAAELDVGAAAGHVCGDRHGARHAGLGDD